MTDKDAMKLALQALENISAFAVGEGDVCEIIAKRARLAAKALEEALAQTEQEQQIETLKRSLFQMQEAAKDLAERAKSLTPPQRTERFGWRKVQIDDAEEEAWRELEKKNEST